MSQEAGTAKAAGIKPAKWWCNFCDFRTDDQKAYLAHSCVEVLKQRGERGEATGKNARG